MSISIIIKGGTMPEKVDKILEGIRFDNFVLNPDTMKIETEEDFFSSKKQALYKAIVEDSRWPKKSKLREESEEWHISNLVTDAENGMISECESILASILGVKE